MNNITHPLYITAICPANGRFMLGGIFRMQDQIGFPVDCSIDKCKELNYDIDWLEALCDCWLNDCLKFDSFISNINSCIPNNRIEQLFKETGAYILTKFPKMKQTVNPVNTVCKYILVKKRLYRWSE